MGENGGISVSLTEREAVSDVLTLKTYDDLDKFHEIWFYIFIWSLFSSIVVHTLSALIATCKLHQHKCGRFYPLVMVIMGVISPLTGGSCTCAVIAVVFTAARWKMSAIMAMCFGVGQTGLLIAVSMSRILATL